MITSDEIREIRQRLGLSQQTFAERIGVGIATVSRWEQGHTAPRPIAKRAIRRLIEEIDRKQRHIALPLGAAISTRPALVHRLGYWLMR